MFVWDHQIVLLIPELMRKMLRARSLINSIFFGTQVFFVVLEGTYVANMLIRSKQMVNPAITQLWFPKLQVTNPLTYWFSSCILYLWFQHEVIMFCMFYSIFSSTLLKIFLCTYLFKDSFSNLIKGGIGERVCLLLMPGFYRILLSIDGYCTGWLVFIWSSLRYSCACKKHEVLDYMVLHFLKHDIRKLYSYMRVLYDLHSFFSVCQVGCTWIPIVIFRHYDAKSKVRCIINNL